MKLNKTDKKALKVALEYGCTHVTIKDGEVEFIPKPKLEPKPELYVWNVYTGELNSIVSAILRFKKVKKISIEELLDEEM